MATIWKATLLWAVYVLVILLSILAVAWGGAMKFSGAKPPAQHETHEPEASGH